MTVLESHPSQKRRKSGAATVLLSEGKWERAGSQPLDRSSRRLVYPPFASALGSVRITNPAGRKGWGTQSIVSERKIEKADHPTIKKLERR